MNSPSDDARSAVERLLRQIPAVDEVLNRPRLLELEGRFGHRLVVEATRGVLRSLRERISCGSQSDISVESLEEEILKQAQAVTGFSLQSVINATGVILHTNLGRAPLAEETRLPISISATTSSTTGKSTRPTPAASP